MFLCLSLVDFNQELVVLEFTLTRFFPLEKVVVIPLNNLQSLQPKDVLFQVPSELAQCMVLEKKIFIVFTINFLLMLLSTLGEGRGSSFDQTWIPCSQGCFVPRLMEIGLVALEKMKMWKIYRQTDKRADGQTADKTWSEKLTWAFSYFWSFIIAFYSMFLHYVYICK